ncbi:14413_t:CDS:1, partial [Dentiscutata erythropus]
VSGSARGDYHACQLDGDLLFAVAYHIHACQLDGDVVEVRAERPHACQPDGERSARKGRPPCPAPANLTAERW